jgi:2-polyprenyl-6-methoxyphenol hydroxylase-like FAD-dependent oxidoreductase
MFVDICASCTFFFVAILSLQLRAFYTYLENAMNVSNVDVLICGAGAAGLTLAIDLARRGVAFRLIEQKNQPFHGSRGKGLQPRTLEVFEDLGLVDRIHALGGPYPMQREHRPDGSHADAPMGDEITATPAEPHSMPWMLPQFLTERVMRERLAELGHAPQFGCELVRLQQDAQGVTATLALAAGTETVRARYLVGADGGHSFVRQALGIGFPGKTLGVRAMVADVALKGLSRDAWHRFNASDMQRQIGFCPLAGTDLFQIQAPVPLEGDVDLSTAGLQAMVTERTGRCDIQVGAVAWASAFSMSARLADRYRVGRVLLVGDAAHTHPPTGGQGLNTSVQDAYNLGWKLDAVLSGAPDSVLDSYEEERRPIAEGVLGLSTRLLDEARRGELRRNREVRQLDLGYPASSLNLQAAPPPHRLQPGDRAPDAPIHRATGLPARLFDLLHGPHWTLLGQDTDRDRIAPHPQLRVHVFGIRGDVIDAHGHFRDAYGLAPNHWVLVRPDGYIGAFVAGDRTDALHAYMRRVGIVQERSDHDRADNQDVLAATAS